MSDYNQNYDFSKQPQGIPPTPPPTTYIGFGDAIKICFQKYATFSGRATRAEYWWFYLFTFVVSMLCVWSEYLTYAVSIALIIPSLAVSWRRMHDIGKGGGWYFINLIPLVGTILWIIWCCRPSEPYPNRFGPYQP